MSSNPAPLISSNFLNDLKSKTSDSHKKLESLPVSSSILSPEMKIEDYCHYLALMQDVHDDTEAVVFPLVSDIIEDLEERKKSQLLENDLQFLNFKKESYKSVFDNQEMSVPFALGVFYVIEGSTLGGRFILKNVTLNEQLSQGKGVSYFSGYGDKTGSYWKSFLNVLEQYEQRFNCGDEIIKGAVYGFESIYNHFLSTEK
ncbi:biliverdin-producing heme oxygenase [Flavobacterium artemisiae]|uniref:Biliverdin-producing heme oxygenase n=1 Tax=Flavobacterium artemisiae TaxID=2126556 RepID=A0ABW4HLJ4_9FLAO